MKFKDYANKTNKANKELIIEDIDLKKSINSMLSNAQKIIELNIAKDIDLIKENPKKALNNILTNVITAYINGGFDKNTASVLAKSGFVKSFKENNMKIDKSLIDSLLNDLKKL